MAEQIRSWTLRLDGTNHYLSVDDGNRLRELLEKSAGGVRAVFTYTAPVYELPVVLQLTPDSKIELSASQYDSMADLRKLS